MAGIAGLLVGNPCPPRTVRRFRFNRLRTFKIGAAELLIGHVFLIIGAMLYIIVRSGAPFW